MAGSPFDSTLYAGLFPTGDVRALWSDRSEIRAMLLVEGALARVQGELGVIPRKGAEQISKAALEVQIDATTLSEPTAQNGVPIPGLVAAFREAMAASEHAQYVHWGATSQDIIDTALVLRLRQSLALIAEDLTMLLRSLGEGAGRYADLPLAARTYGQNATPTSFGAILASWGAPLLELSGQLDALKETCLWVSLSGAAGTSSALGPQAAEMRAALAKELGLIDPQRSWHTDRTPLLRIGDWLTRLTLATAKIGADAIAMTQSGVEELQLGGSGASSTMPQKQNPVGPSVLVALARQATGANTTLQNASVHQYQRDGAAWFTEWLCLPQIVLSAASAARTARTVLEDIEPAPENMTAVFEQGLDLIHAEALSFALCSTMARPDAQAAVKTLCKTARETQTPLRFLVQKEWPDLDLSGVFDPAHQMGTAPADARRFAELVQEKLRQE